MIAQDDIFSSAVASGLPPSQIRSRNDHPVPRTGIPASVSAAIPTNKFYANLFLAEQQESVWTHPYSLQWNHGGGLSQSWGMGISHIDRSMFAFGEGEPSKYYLSPVGIRSMILSARELGPSTTLTTHNHQAFSVQAKFHPNGGADAVLTMPLVQGMGFITGVYRNCTPLLQSHVLFRSLREEARPANGSKFRAVLEDGFEWLIYVFPADASRNMQLRLESNTTISGFGHFNGVVQIAKAPAGAAGDSIYNASAGVYPTEGNISANTSGNFTFSWKKGGNQSKKLLMFALPHHVDAFSGSTRPAVTSIRLQTTTKGIASGVHADQWHMFEKLPTSIGFAPWSRTDGVVTNLPNKTKSLINQVAAQELNQNIDAQTNLDSMYFSGKGLAKFAMIVYVVSDLVKNKSLAASGLAKLKQAFHVFVQNRQQFPLVYDQKWGGLVSSAGWQDPMLDFGGTMYNDHHFHYGYFVYTAAVIGHLDRSWLNTGTNKAWVNSLVRDFANSVAGAQFPFSRAFDWYHGHSWAKGLFASADGKDQESTSEDAFASYALKMWGRVIGDNHLEARGNLMLAIQARSFHNYFLMDSDNHNQPQQFIGNKVTGILFENKCDHATYFGLNPEYIQGIHMIPMASPSAFIRRPKFVAEEWAVYFDQNRARQVEGGWRGILFANLALIHPKMAYEFFSQANFDNGLLDGGASRTWYLAYAAALGGA